jgi:hypothetical protein
LVLIMFMLLHVIIIIVRVHVFLILPIQYTSGDLKYVDIIKMKAPKAICKRRCGNHQPRILLQLRFTPAFVGLNHLDRQLLYLVRI